MANAFLQQVDAFVEEHGIPIVQFRKGQRKDDVAAEYRTRFQGAEGVLFLGKAQEKVNVFRTEKRTAENGKKYPWIVKSSVPVNQFYFYCIDEDFGPFFLKFCTYFPYNAKLSINGHEYVKRQLAKEGIAFEPLDNGVLSCAAPKHLQQICDGLRVALEVGHRIEGRLNVSHVETLNAAISRQVMDRRLLQGGLSLGHHLIGSMQYS